MKKILLAFCVAMLCSSIACAQKSDTPHRKTDICYSYDDAGNRINRRSIILNSTPPPNLVSASFTKEKISEVENPEVFEENFNERKISIYPNPTKGNLGVHISGSDFGNKCQAQLFSVMGKCLLQTNLQAGVINTISMTHLSPSMYVLVLIFDDEKLTYKIIKQ